MHARLPVARLGIGDGAGQLVTRSGIGDDAALGTAAGRARTT